MTMGKTQHKESERLCPDCKTVQIFPVRNQCHSAECAREYRARKEFRASIGEELRKILDLMKGNIPYLPEGRERERAQRQYDKLRRKVTTSGLLEKRLSGQERRN
jgi:hypothetical protein